MSKTLKRSASMFMALVMILAMVPVMSVTANAAAYTGNYDTLSQGTPTGADTDSMALFMDKPFYVAISENVFGGTDFTVANAKTRQGLSLGNMGITGTLRGLEKFTNLTHFILSNNKFEGALPDISAMPNLWRISLENNLLTGKLSDLGTSTNPTLTYITLGTNYITGDLTPLLNYPNLRVINMGTNKVVGQIPDLSGLTKLEECYLNYNGTTGTLPALPDSITHFQLAVNNTTGSIPESYIHLPNLQVLNLVSNHLTGTIPAFGSDSTSLKQLMIGYTNISGPVPESLCNLDITLLGLHGLTGLTGELPSGLAGKKVITTGTKFDTNLGALSDKAKYTTGAWMEINKDVNGDGIADLNIDTANTPDSIPDLNIDVNGDGKADINIIVAGQVTILVPSFNQGTRIDVDGMVLGWYRADLRIKADAPTPLNSTHLQVSSSYPYFLEETAAWKGQIFETNVVTILVDDGTGELVPHEVVPPPVNELVLNDGGNNVDIDGDGIPDLGVVGNRDTTPPSADDVDAFGIPNPKEGAKEPSNPIQTEDPSAPNFLSPGGKIPADLYNVDSTGTGEDVKNKLPPEVTLEDFEDGTYVGDGEIEDPLVFGLNENGDVVGVPEEKAEELLVTSHKIALAISSYNPSAIITISLYEAGKLVTPVTLGAASGSGQTTRNTTIDAKPGTYDLVVTKPGHLTYTITGVVVGDSDIDLKASGQAYSTITLLAGDVNGNGTIDYEDSNVIYQLNNFNKSTSVGGVDINADINGDGVIDYDDVNIVYEPIHYNRSTTNCTVSFS